MPVAPNLGCRWPGRVAWSTSALQCYPQHPTCTRCTGRTAANRLGCCARAVHPPLAQIPTVIPTASPLSAPQGVPGQGSPGRAAWGRVPAHSTISCSGSSSLATQTEPQHGLGRQIHRRRHCGSGGEPGVPTAGRCHCPALPRESTRTPSCVVGKARRKLCCSVSSRASHRRGWREPETSSAPRGGQGALAPCSPPPSALTQTNAQ